MATAAPGEPMGSVRGLRWPSTQGRGKIRRGNSPMQEPTPTVVSGGASFPCSRGPWGSEPPISGFGSRFKACGASGKSRDPPPDLSILICEIMFRFMASESRPACTFHGLRALFKSSEFYGSLITAGQCPALVEFVTLGLGRAGRTRKWSAGDVALGASPLP